ncbi:MAG: helix-turn-helix domain-containing protein [Firmicutes bacterium]|nr:helix-turn-helix domain-containing protein [Bacillota bacterium]
MKAYKTEICLNKLQIREIEKAMSACRFLYNFYLESCNKIFNQYNKYISADDFYNLIRTEYINNNENFAWLDDIKDFSLLYNIKKAENELRKFYFGERDMLSFKKKVNSSIKLYLDPIDDNMPVIIQRHRVKLASLGWIRLKEYGYIPEHHKIINVFISKKIGKYFITVITDEEAPKPHEISDTPLSDEKVDYLLKKLKREQRSLSRKYKALSERSETDDRPTRKNINKQIVRIQKIKNKLGLI